MVQGFDGSAARVSRYFVDISMVLTKTVSIVRCVVSLVSFRVRRLARRELTSLASDSSSHLMEIFLGVGCLGEGCFLTSMVKVPFSYLDSILEKSVFSGMRSARC